MSRKPAHEAEEIVSFLREVDGYQPTVPEEVVRHYLQLGGAACDDPTTLKLVALATDKFLADIVHEAKELGQLRRSTGIDGPPEVPHPLGMQDLAESLRQRGVKITKPASMPVSAEGASRGGDEG